MFLFNVSICITFLLFTIGCDCNRRFQNGSTNFHQVHTKPLIVLFHGLGANVSSLKTLQEALENEFGKESVVVLDNILPEKTAIFSIKDQSNKCFNKLSEDKPNLQHSPTLLIGHSQGGLRAYNMFHQYKDELNVKGIITLATPWEGAPLLDTIETLNQCDTITGIKNKELYSKYFTPPVLNDMYKLSDSMGQPTNWIEQELVRRLENLVVAEFIAGCYDLKPGSIFLNSIKDALPEEEVPILAIGGGASDFKIFLPKETSHETSHDFKHLNSAWTKIIVGETDLNETDFDLIDNKHDMIVPLYSQLAWHITNKENFKRKIIEDAPHDELLKEFPIEAFKNILCHPTMVKEVIQFAKDIFYSDSITCECQVLE
ncbi:esterase/lipase family protein [Candidatus Cardinium hertigii]|uniref:esterase/lipase family protein n=1 Tax=Candidatus Cardinium hertigii TaxID=247481 RepID=UPI003D7E0BED